MKRKQNATEKPCDHRVQLKKETDEIDNYVLHIRCREYFPPETVYRELRCGSSYSDSVIDIIDRWTASGLREGLQNGVKERTRCEIGFVWKCFPSRDTSMSFVDGTSNCICERTECITFVFHLIKSLKCSFIFLRFDVSAHVGRCLMGSETRSRNCQLTFPFTIFRFKSHVNFIQSILSFRAGKKGSYAITISANSYKKSRLSPSPS